MILGIDPGMMGAFAFVTEEGHLVEVFDMPVAEVRGKRRISAALVANVMKFRPVSLVAIEGVHSMPGQGVSSSFSFGYGAGILEGVAAALNLPVEITMANVWKRRAGVSADKGAARQMAQRYWPGAAASFARVKDDGRADASLLARWVATR